MNQAARRTAQAGRVTREDQAFNLSGVTVVIPAGQQQSACLLAGGMLIAEALAGLIEVGMHNLSTDDATENVVWSTVHLLTAAKAMNQAAQSAESL